MTANLFHPYTDGIGTWVRGSFHGHCSEHSGCSSVPLVDSVRWYQEAGVAFVTVTDHDHVTDLTEMRRMFPHLVFLEGFEYSSCENLVFAGPHVGPLHTLALGEALKRCPRDILTMVCHPHPHADGREYWTLEKLQALGSWPHGIEVYNGHYGTDTALAHGRQPLGTALWDQVLSLGRRLWGYANDDFHDPEDAGNAWTMVQVEQITGPDIVAAAQAGRCYATTGLLLEHFQIHGRTLRIQLSAPAAGRFIGPQGRVLAEHEDTHFEYTLADEAYVRFQAEGEAGRIFLQPAFPAS